MEVLKEKIKDVVLLKIKGRLVVEPSKDLKEMVSALINEKYQKIIISLKDVSFIDSSGLGSLVAILKLVDKSGGNLKIAELQENINDIFQMTRLNRVFAIYRSVKEAFDSF